MPCTLSEVINYGFEKEMDDLPSKQTDNISIVIRIRLVTRRQSNISLGSTYILFKRKNYKCSLVRRANKEFSPGLIFNTDLTKIKS